MSDDNSLAERLKDEDIFDLDGIEEFDAELCVAKMLLGGVLFVNSRKYMCDYRKSLQKETLVLFLNCNDTFAWGGTDAEEVSYEDIKDLYKMWKASPVHGTTKWVCVRRNEKPQKPLQELLKKAGEWDDIFEKLPENRSDTFIENTKKLTTE